MRRYRGYLTCREYKDHALQEDWNAISPRMKKALVKLMARISEKSYRRGVQQAAVLIANGLIKYDDEVFFRYRYEPSLDAVPALNFLPKIKSPSYCPTSLERLNYEYHDDLFRLGIYIDEFTKG